MYQIIQEIILEVIWYKSVGDIKIIPLESYIEPVNDFEINDSNELRQAIQKQQEFLGGKLKN